MSRPDPDFARFEANMKAAMGTLAPVVANEAVNFFRGSFTKQAWIGTNTNPWKKRKGNKDAGRAILVKSGRLRRSIRDMGSAGMKVRVGTDVPYAAAHNEGFSGTVSVREHSRKRTRKAKVSMSNVATRKKSTRTTKITAGNSSVKSHSRKMNLPKRQFIGNSPYLNKLIDRTIQLHLSKHL